MNDAEYRMIEMYNQLKRGPYPGENFFRLQVTGRGSTRHVNISGDQLQKIALILGEDD